MQWVSKTPIKTAQKYAERIEETLRFLFRRSWTSLHAAANISFVSCCGGDARALKNEGGVLVRDAAVALGAFCFACGQAIDARAEICPKCGVRQKRATGTKSRGSAALLAFFLGGIGIHKFYLGRPFQGIIYLLFFWTLIPGIIAFIEFIVYLCMSDESFAAKYG
ncbi:MAG: TM2 domain-containing protein [Cystobacterineae bacterium]|nr:TM2 domain-containing protein [Cystobacterineae bacterium]